MLAADTQTTHVPEEIISEETENFEWIFQMLHETQGTVADSLEQWPLRPDEAVYHLLLHYESM